MLAGFAAVTTETQRWGGGHEGDKGESRTLLLQLLVDKADLLFMELHGKEKACIINS